MKTQVIQLYLHDDLASIRDRMTWAKTPRILLVWPRSSGVEVRPLDLTLLHRHAQSLGADLGLVTRDREMRAAARELNISVFSKSDDAQKKPWKERHSARPVRRFPPQNLRAARGLLPANDPFNFAAHPVRRVLVFAIGVLAVLAVTLVFIPSANIRIVMPEERQVLTISVSTDAEAKNVQLSGVVPQRKLTIAVDGAGSALASGSVIQPEIPATGQILLMNLTDKAVTVPSGTVLLTNTDPVVAFMTDNNSEVPPGKGKTANVSVHARDAGILGNVDPGTLTLFEGTLGQKLAANNLEAISGGTQMIVAQPTQQDRDNLKKRLLADLQRQALAGFEKKISSGDMLLPATLAETSVVDETFTPAAGETGQKVTLSMRVEYSINYAAFADMHLLAERVLDASLPPGYRPTTNVVDIRPISGPSEAQGAVRWQIQAERGMRADIDPEQVISLVEGRSLTRARELLTNTYGLSEPPQINVLPGFWPWLPFLPIQIAVMG